MESQSRHFVLMFFSAVPLLSLVICLLNILVDPYSLFASRNWLYTVNSRAAGISTVNERMTKSYDVLRKAPNSLILGTSSVDVGLDARSPAWPRATMPVYNLGIFSIDLHGMYQYLRHVIRAQPISLVVIGVDFDQFLGRWVHPLAEKDQIRLDRPPVGVWPQDFLRGSLSFDALADSINAVANEAIGEHPKYLAGNRPEDDFWLFKRREGPAGFFWITDIRNISVAALKPVSLSQIDDLHAIVELCRVNDIRAIIVINPIHVNLLETYSRLGYWQAFENWKRELVSMTMPLGDERRPPVNIELWDFSEYDQYSTTDLPQATDWFWDSNHYTRRLGDLMLRRIFTSGDPEFGVRLSPDTIEQHLQMTRERQLQYRLTHLGAVESLQQLFKDTPH